MVVAALVLNFVPDREKALTEMKRAARPGGTVAFYVWDYPGGGIEFMRAFWTAATALDPAAADLTEDKRFPFCTPDRLTHFARSAGLSAATGSLLRGWRAGRAPRGRALLSRIQRRTGSFGSMIVRMPRSGRNEQIR